MDKSSHMCSVCDKVGELMKRRFICRTCEHFELCGDCFSELYKHHDLSHEWSEFRKHEEYAIDRFIHTGFACDGEACGSSKNIKGVRFHCSECDDFDMCESCYFRFMKGEKANHPKDHVFLPHFSEISATKANILDVGKNKKKKKKKKKNLLSCKECTTGKKIIGDIFSCKICKDYFICIKHYNIRHKSKHPRNHKFSKLPKTQIQKMTNRRLDRTQKNLVPRKITKKSPNNTRNQNNRTKTQDKNTFVTTDVQTINFDVLGLIVAFIPSSSTFMKLLAVSKHISSFLNNNGRYCSRHLKFSVRNPIKVPRNRSKMKYVQNLVLEKKKIPRDFFSRFPYLQSLELIKCSPQGLSITFDEGCVKNLRTLVLDNTKGYKVSQIKKFRNLRIFKLEESHMYQDSDRCEIGRWISKFTKLEEICLSNCKTNAGFWIGVSTIARRLRKFKICGKSGVLKDGYYDVDDVIGRMERLEVLHLERVKVSPEGLKNLKNLMKVHITICKTPNETEYLRLENLRGVVEMNIVPMVNRRLRGSVRV